MRTIRFITCLKLVVLSQLLYFNCVAANGNYQSAPQYYFVISGKSFGQASFYQVTGLDGNRRGNMVLSNGAIYDKRRAGQFLNPKKSEDMTLQLVDMKGNILQTWLFRNSMVVSYKITGRTPEGGMTLDSVSVNFSYYMQIE